MIVDKVCIQQIIGCLMKKPQLLSEIDKYTLTPNDFSTKFEKSLFVAINGLYAMGAIDIAPIDIENYLSSSSSAATIFKQNNGIEYLQDIEEFCSIENFPYYYSKLKKMNLLRDLKKMGFSISDFYVEDLTDPRALEVNSNFESLSIKDIVDRVKKKLAMLDSEYTKTNEVSVEKAADNIEDFWASLQECNEIGLPIQGKIINHVINGAQRGCLTIRSGASGTGKTRAAVTDACYLAYPIRFNWTTCQWEQVGSCEKVLFVITEQQVAQIKRMILAYLTDINESRFTYGQFSEMEEKVINQAIEVMKEYAANFIIVRIPDPSIELVKTLIRENCLIYDIGYVFYDYIFISTALLSEFRGFNLRNDELLLLFATALKDLAVELDVCVFTSTQVNANVDDNKNIRNESSLAGGRATINKADNGVIMARPTKEELDILETLIANFGLPNLVTDVFKVRSGEWTQVRIWSIVDFGRMKREDLFITDARLDAIKDFEKEEFYMASNWDSAEFEETKRKVDELNGLLRNN